jgi:4-aminobutyrate aminotransferase / (S)-3-amino-2-methylpropionate transaminase / 5-aminovalerate transaminase
MIGNRPSSSRNMPRPAPMPARGHLVFPFRGALMGANQDLLARRAAIVPRGLPQVTMATAARAEGAVIRDAEDRELIDFAGGIGVMNVGHGHPRVVRAIQDQAEQLLHTCIHVATYEPYVALCERLAALFPHGDATKVLLLNSGAEAVENAVKIARQATGRQAVICYADAFHGRTLMAMTLSSKVGLKAGCGPYAPEVYRLPYPNRYRHGDGLDEEAFVERELERLHRFFADTVAADTIAVRLGA